MMRIVAALLLACCTAGALAQGPGSGEPRTPPPAPPLREPARPDESPGKAQTLPESAAPADNPSREASDRCAELTGAMRSQCLLEQQGGATGASSAPAPRTAPPPQNPR